MAMLGRNFFVDGDYITLRDMTPEQKNTLLERVLMQLDAATAELRYLKMQNLAERGWSLDQAEQALRGM